MYKESFLEDGFLCIVQEFCEKGDLYAHIQQRKKAGHQPFSEDTIIKWFCQAMLGLKFIHEKHILHRDLKSSNFFLTKSGDIKMGDFGISKVLESTQACAKTQIGTPYYLSPEICQEKPYTFSSDIWAMGCILYELCCLKVPFDASDLRALVQRITRGPSPSLPSHFPSQLRQLVHEILVRDQHRRPTAGVILSKPILADRARKLMNPGISSSNNSGSEPGAEAGGAKGCDNRDGSSNSDIRAVEEKINAGGGGGQNRNSDGPYASDAGRYVKNQIVEYWSETHKEWLPAQIIAVDADGRVQVHCKPNAWLGLSIQAKRLRPKQDGNNGVNVAGGVNNAVGVPNKADYASKGGGGGGIKPPCIPNVSELVGKNGNGSRYNTPRQGAATPPMSGNPYHRQATPPYQLPPGSGRGHSPSGYGHNNGNIYRPATPRGLGYRVGTPRGSGVGGVGTPRGQSPLIRAQSPRNHIPAGGNNYPPSNRFY